MSVHTYHKFSDTRYGVGLWLMTHKGITSFHTMFEVTTQLGAFRAVNALNGGNMDAILSTKEIAKESPPSESR